jgi:hypothetical protein
LRYGHHHVDREIACCGIAPVIASRGLVLLYIGTAHLSLALAFALAGSDPLAIAGFFYHARLVAIVHLITIGWIGMSILGMVYVVLPMTFGVAFAAGRADYGAYAFALIGLVGMVAHFWLEEFNGMAWSAAMAAAGIAYVMVRLARHLPNATVPGGVKLHLYFACINILAAMTMGVLLGFDKVHHFLPGYVLSNVFAHAHLAAIGWVSMVVTGVAYRLLPMVIPAASPTGSTIYISAVLLEAGIAGLFVSLLLRSTVAPLFAALIISGFVAAGAHVAWMLRRRRTPSPAAGPRFFAIAHIAAAAFWLLCACVSGIVLTALPMTEITLRGALAYGVFGLVGFLAQIIVGFEVHVLPTVAAYWTLQQSGSTAARARHRPAELQQMVVYCAWLTGVPAVAAGLVFNVPVILATGAWMLFAATVVNAIGAALLIVPPPVSGRE